MKRITFQKPLAAVVCAAISSLLLTAISSTAQVFIPNQAFLLQISTDESPGFGGTGHPISITANGLNAVDYTVMFGLTGDTKVAVDRTSFGPTLDLSAFTGTTVNEKVLSGTASVQLFVQGGSPNFAFDTANGPGGQTSANGIVPISYTFASDPNLTPNSLIRYGLQFFGTAGQTATIEFSTTPAPEPSSIAFCALGAMGGVPAFLRRRKA